jgi:DNA-binding response OmpR family regulator
MAIDRSRSAGISPSAGRAHKTFSRWAIEDPPARPITMLTRHARQVRAGHLVVDPLHYEVLWDDRPLLRLTRIEFRLLYLLALNSHQLIPYARLVRFAWGYAEDMRGGAGLLKTHISHLRRKLRAVAAHSVHIDNVERSGYRLVCDAPAEIGSLRKDGKVPPPD